MYLSKVAKKSTDDPVFKFLEKRHQWQRRNFNLGDTSDNVTYAIGDWLDGDATTDTIKCYVNYDKFGSIQTAEYKPEFFVAGLVVAIEDTLGTVRRFEVTTTPSAVAKTSVPTFAEKSCPSCFLYFLLNGSILYPNLDTNLA